MSASKKRAPRRERDAYYTPEWATRALLEVYRADIRSPDAGLLLDPCCGDGRMVRQIMEAGQFTRCAINDIAEPSALDVPGCIRASGLDARDPAIWTPESPAWVVSNPPFSLAGEIVWTALQHAYLGVAMLLRCTFLEPCKGRQWLLNHPPTSILALPRISFTGTGATDSAPTWWFVWKRHSSLPMNWKQGTVHVETRAIQQQKLALVEELRLPGGDVGLRRDK